MWGRISTGSTRYEVRGKKYEVRSMKSDFVPLTSYLRLYDQQYILNGYRQEKNKGRLKPGEAFLFFSRKYLFADPARYRLPVKGGSLDQFPIILMYPDLLPRACMRDHSSYRIQSPGSFLCLQHSVTPNLVFAMTGFENLKMYPLISSEDHLSETPSFIYGVIDATLLTC
jgi:hypothetical protein